MKRDTFGRAVFGLAFAFILVASGAVAAAAAATSSPIPEAAWRRPIGLPLETAGAGRRAAGVEADHIDDGYWQGAPVGGFGAGTFSRTYRGDFARWHVKAGVHKYESVPANQFAMYQRAEGDAQGVAQVLMAGRPAGGQLTSWAWGYPVGAGDYAALYPKSWFDYRWDRFPAHVVLEQLSPILPDNYRETSYPVAVYRWHAENPSSRPVTVSVLLSWTNMVGWFRDSEAGFKARENRGNRNRAQSADGVTGIVFDRDRAGGVTEEGDGQFVIATPAAEGVEVTYQTTFDANGDGSEVWQPFAQDGRLASRDASPVSAGADLAGAIAVRFTLQPGEKRVVPMVVAWDLPIVQFGKGRKWYRHYTDFYGTSGENAWSIARDGLLHAADWSAAIDAWQAPYVNDATRPLWYRGMLWNELYVIADGSSFWGRPVGSDPTTPHSFGFLESCDYVYYATLDVRFYGSMPLVRFWPEIDKRVLRQFAATVPLDLRDRQPWYWKSMVSGKPETRLRKVKGAVPHDLGVPSEDPFVQVNDFNWQDTSGWKDLPSQFVLMVYRDFALTGRRDLEFLRETWPAVQETLAHLGSYDKNGDGIPENEGYPDQTYDAWVVSGESAYCGSLWLGALRAAEEIGKALGDESAAAKYRDLFTRGQKSYVKKLWNGDYFSYDTASESRNSVQADQLAGQWYANLTGLGDLVPRDMRRRALQTIFGVNVMKFAKGEMGAVNGISAVGELLPGSPQAQEVWTGTTLALASFMLSEGLRDEAFRTAWGIYHTSYEVRGYWFRTPEAWDKDGRFRASTYMRPAAIWAMEMVPQP